jgi:ABC-type spermidine/putrescine transport system permease subunit I
VALPGVAWLVVLFAVPFYAILAVACGDTDPIFGQPIPQWNPLQWKGDAFVDVWDGFVHGTEFRRPFLRTGLFVGTALALCYLIGYPVAYFVARHGGRRKAVWLGLLLAPFWISYLMRMLAWVNLLQDDGYASRALGAVGLEWFMRPEPTLVLGLVYGYVPFLILPLYAALDRIDARLIEASRDLGVGPWQTFRRVTLPLSRQGMLAAGVITALPMLGDYYTRDLLAPSTRTTMVGNQIQFLLRQSGASKQTGAALVVVFSALLAGLMVWYLRATSVDTQEARA